tara:strand:+ start:1229 stop:1909 length:681 start_codon:yes stop_codon:yes gene_type:complete
MAMVYDNLKGAFKEGKPTDEPKNNSGMMSRQLNTLSNAGPEGHSLAYITPEEEKLLKKATGKETITTAYGIPTYETEMTLEEMEAKLSKDKINEIYNEAIQTGKSQNRSSISKAGQEGILSPQETNEALTKSTEDDINIIYKMLIEDELAKYDTINNMRLDVKAANLIKRGVNKVKSLMGNTNKKESVDKPVTPQFDMNKDYNLNKFLQEQQNLMSSKEDYIPPQP